MRNNTTIKIGLILLTCSALGACSAADRIAQIGEAPEMTKIVNPTTQRGYQPVSLPMPSPKNVAPQKNSLWAADRTTFFKDQRASDVGDIITVMIDIDDKAELENATSRKRASNEDAALPALLGYEQALDRILPQAIDNTDLIDFGADSSHSGTGSVERDEKVEVQLAAFITQILPNGNMVIHGSQEVLVNFEKRILQVDGVIRPEDISVQNSISYEKIAEARIAYGGEGQITDVQQPRYGQQLYDIVFPF
ncbi:MAG TPA: flagellar basal body L-ring protein FlgH [Alphaproteobacteria bacterium]|nr:flagellar basal body L-ring protein FlgH [Alphaproteobacteria bacterium]USO06641.1 MAG: flagellar basal body L-ring protein FlgH [Rhodospirillales bacterium]HOO82279.1 flagellar basal body L-ring protein FlgH [Alphaproteobacteria bacterium]